MRMLDQTLNTADITYSEPSDSDEQCVEHDLRSDLSELSDSVMRVDVQDSHRIEVKLPDLNNSASVEARSTYIPKAKKQWNTSF